MRQRNQLPSESDGVIELKPYRIDIGERFGTLTVEQEVGARDYRVACRCSYVFIARGSKLRRGLVKCRRCADSAGRWHGRSLVEHYASKRTR